MQPPEWHLCLRHRSQDQTPYIETVNRNFSCVTQMRAKSPNVTLHEKKQLWMFTQYVFNSVFHFVAE
jgi:hypothetical protein